MHVISAGGTGDGMALIEYGDVDRSRLRMRTQTLRGIQKSRLTIQHRTTRGRVAVTNGEDGTLMQYHHLIVALAHRAGFWFFTVVFPAMFALFWLTLILLAYGVIGIG